jgi:hypothetical protein
MTYTGVQDLNADFVSVRGRNLNLFNLEGLASTQQKTAIQNDGLTKFQNNVVLVIT